jgi:hypothetical protein
LLDWVKSFLSSHCLTEISGSVNASSTSGFRAVRLCSCSNLNTSLCDRLDDRLVSNTGVQPLNWIQNFLSLRVLADRLDGKNEGSPSRSDVLVTRECSNSNTLLYNRSHLHIGLQSADLTLNLLLPPGLFVSANFLLTA